MESFVDLHIHSSASDGDFPPEQIPVMAAQRGLSAVALTDHDTVEGIPAFLDAARKVGIEAIPGVEVGIANDPERGLREVHVLAYFVEPGDNPLARTLDKLIEAKRNWAVRQVERLEAEGYKVPFDEVAAQAEAGASIRRPHIWRVFQRNNPGALSAQQFYRATDFGGALYASKDFAVSLEEVVDIIRKSGAVSVLAHPAFYGAWPGDVLRVLDYACTVGIQGVETLYAYDAVPKEDGFPSQDEVARVLAGEAGDRGLVMTGGSDFHGSAVPEIQLGCVNVPYEWVSDLRGRHRSGRA